MNVTKNIKSTIEEYKELGYEFWRDTYNNVFGVIPGSMKSVSIAWENKKVVVTHV